MSGEPRAWPIQKWDLYSVPVGNVLLRGVLAPAEPLPQEALYRLDMISQGCDTSLGRVAAQPPADDPLSEALDYYDARTVEHAVCCAIENGDIATKPSLGQGMGLSRWPRQAQGVAQQLSAGATLQEIAELNGLSLSGVESICERTNFFLGTGTMAASLRRMYELGYMSQAGGQRVKKVNVLLPASGEVDMTSQQILSLDERSRGTTYAEHIQRYGWHPSKSLKGARKALRASTSSEAILKAVALGVIRIEPDVAAFCAPLTASERDVICLISQGTRDDLIARRLGVTKGYVSARSEEALKKLDVSNRAHAVRRLITLDFLQPRFATPAEAA